MGTFIRLALVAIVFLTGASALAMAAPYGGCDNICSDEVSPAWPLADFWDQLKVGR